MTPAPPTIDARLAAIEGHLAALVERSGVTPRWLTIALAAVYASVSQKTVRQWISAGKLTPHRACRGLIHIDRLELDQLIGGSTSVPRKSRGRSAGTLAAIHGKMNGEN